MKDAKLWAQRDETRFTRQVELTTPNVLVLIHDSVVVVVVASLRYGSVLMLALWVSLARGHRSHVARQGLRGISKKQEKKERVVTCLSRDPAEGRSHQRVLSSRHIPASPSSKGASSLANSLRTRHCRTFL